MTINLPAITQSRCWFITNLSHFCQLTVLILGVFPSLLSANASLSQLQINLTDKHGNPLQHGVVSLHKKSTNAQGDATAHVTKPAMMEQVNLQFSPAVIAVQTGTPVIFPSRDEFGHHVYSFSHPNAFELQLHHGEDSSPETFLHPGIVVLGCNIHDGMLGYIRVVDSPFFATTTNNGEAHLSNLPAGDYEVQIWHPDLGTDIISQSIQVSAGKVVASYQIAGATGEPVQAAAEPVYGSTYSYEY